MLRRPLSAGRHVPIRRNALSRTTQTLFRAGLLGFVVTSAVRGQGTEVSVLAGLVVDSAGVGISDAEISVVPDGPQARTDAGGEFYLRVPVGTVVVRARRVGFRPLEHTAELRPGRSTVLRLVMQPAAQALPSVETRERAGYLPAGAPAFLDDFYRRRAEGRGLYFTREDFESLPNLASVIRTVPSMRVWEDMFGEIEYVAATRCSSLRPTDTVAWYLDGMRISGVPPGIDLRGIEAIEIYRGSSSLPAEAIGNSCAAIFIWTRRSP